MAWERKRARNIPENYVATGYENIERYFEEDMHKTIRILSWMLEAGLTDAEGRILTKALWWTHVKKGEPFYKTYKEFADELFLSESGFKKGKNMLEEKGLLTTDSCIKNGVKTTYFAVNMEKVKELKEKAEQKTLSSFTQETPSNRSQKTLSNSTQEAQNAISNNQKTLSSFTQETQNAINNHCQKTLSDFTQEQENCQKTLSDFSQKTLSDFSQKTLSDFTIYTEIHTEKHNNAEKANAFSSSTFLDSDLTPIKKIKRSDQTRSKRSKNIGDPQKLIGDGAFGNGWENDAMLCEIVSGCIKMWEAMTYHGKRGEWSKEQIDVLIEVAQKAKERALAKKQRPLIGWLSVVQGVWNDGGYSEKYAKIFCNKMQKDLTKTEKCAILSAEEKQEAKPTAEDGAEKDIVEEMERDPRWGWDADFVINDAAGFKKAIQGGGVIGFGDGVFDFWEEAKKYMPQHEIDEFLYECAGRQWERAKEEMIWLTCARRDTEHLPARWFDRGLKTRFSLQDARAAINERYDAMFPVNIEDLEF